MDGICRYYGLHLHSKNLIVIVALLLGLFIMLACEFKSAAKKKSGAMKSLNHKIIAVLIRYGGEMGCSGIGKHLGLPSETVAAGIEELERKGMICRKGNDNICLKV